MERHAGRVHEGRDSVFQRVGAVMVILAGCSGAVGVDVVGCVRYREEVGGEDVRDIYLHHATNARVRTAWGTGVWVGCCKEDDVCWSRADAASSGAAVAAAQDVSVAQCA